MPKPKIDMIDKIKSEAPRLLEWLTGMPAEQWQCEVDQHGIDFFAPGCEASICFDDSGQCSLHTERTEDGDTCDFSGTWEQIYDEVFLLPD